MGTASRASDGMSLDGTDTHNAHEVDNHRGQVLLHMRVDQALVAGATDPHDSHFLREQAPDAWPRARHTSDKMRACAPPFVAAGGLREPLAGTHSQSSGSAYSSGAPGGLHRPGWQQRCPCILPPETQAGTRLSLRRGAARCLPRSMEKWARSKSLPASDFLSFCIQSL